MLPVIGWYLLYLCNFHIIKMQDWGIAGHFWSLSVEEQFYLVWPFIILLVPNKRLPLVMAMSIGISIAAKSYWYATPTDFWSAYVNPLAALDVLAFGALLSYLYYFHNEWLKKILYNPFTGAIVALQVMVCIYCDGVLHSKFAHIIAIRPSFGLFSIWLIGRAAFGFRGITGYILNSRALRYIGKISYAIYLFHPFVPGILEKVKYPQEENLRFIMYAVVAMGAASISWYLFESRILKFKERFE